MTMIAIIVAAFIIDFLTANELDNISQLTPE
jgi:hypothetical protein